MFLFISLKENTNSSKNIKRESKLYTYKEQMEEIELRKVSGAFLVIM